MHKEEDGEGGSGSGGLSERRMAEVQAMLEAVQEEAASIEATAGATPPGGWGDLALAVVAAPAGQLPQPSAAQKSAGGRRAASPAVRAAAPPPVPAQLLECCRCRKVLLACSAAQHQRQCSQQPEATVGGAAPETSIGGQSSDARSSSDGAPAAVPSGSRGSKRKRLSGAAAAAAAAKASRLSKGGSHRAGSVEATPSFGEWCCCCCWDCKGKHCVSLTWLRAALMLLAHSAALPAWHAMT